MQDRTDAGKNGCRAGWMQDRMESTIDAGQDGCRKGWIQYRIKCVKILALNELDFLYFWNNIKILRIKIFDIC